MIKKEDIEMKIERSTKFIAQPSLTLVCTGLQAFTKQAISKSKRPFQETVYNESELKEIDIKLQASSFYWKVNHKRTKIC